MAFKLKSGNSPLYNQLGTPPEYSRWQTAVEKFHEKGHGQSYTGKDIYQKGKKKRDEKRRKRQEFYSKVKRRLRRKKEKGTIGGGQYEALP